MQLLGMTIVAIDTDMWSESTFDMRIQAVI